jgi:hypothetical protein
MNSHQLSFSRRGALQGIVAGFGHLAFADLSTWAVEKDNPLAPKKPHFPARAKRVIFLCMEGGPSQIDTFDYKPRLAERNGKSMPKADGSKLMASHWKFAQHGESGQWISELLPELAKHADDLCVLRGMQTDVPAHPQAFNQLHTGVFSSRRPSLGAWAYYGLGTENESLPGFFTINPSMKHGGPANYSNVFLPAVYQGTPINTAIPSIGGGDDVPKQPVNGGVKNTKDVQVAMSNIKNPKLSVERQRKQIDYIQALNREMLEREPKHAGVEGAIESLELAFRMQKELPKVMDFSKESSATKALYGIGEQATENFGLQCLFARRLIEFGVRFVQVTSSDWDHHAAIKKLLPDRVLSIDKPIAGLLKDLKSRGLLEDTLVVWGGEFGRTPYVEGSDGRDHNHKGFTTWMAGGGVKSGFSYGATDEYGYEAVEGKIHIHDWHATILHLLGLDHEKLTFRYGGRDMRLTDVKGVVAKDIIA